MLKVAINGFGRVGRYIIRAAIDNPNIHIVAVNSRSKDTKLLAHILKYDSVHGTARFPIRYDENHLIVKGKKIKVVSETENLEKLPWKEMKVDIVFESTGNFRDKESNQGHLKAGAKIVIIGAPGKDVDATFVMGVNEKDFDPRKHKIISNASCTTNCLAPLVKVINDKFGVEDGMMTTIHSYTMDQRILDGTHKDLRRSRAGAVSMIPTSTGAAKAIGKVIPELNNKLSGISIRVPTPNVSVVDLVLTLKKSATVKEVNEALIHECRNGMRGIMKCTDEELVSVDFVSSPYSSIVDLGLTTMIGEKRLKLFSWYDNESGYSHRMVDLAIYIGKILAETRVEEEIPVLTLKPKKVIVA